MRRWREEEAGERGDEERGGRWEEATVWKKPGRGDPEGQTRERKRRRKGLVVWGGGRGREGCRDSGEGSEGGKRRAGQQGEEKPG